MTSTSTIPDVLDALEDLLVPAYRDAGPTGPVQVTQGPPQSAERERIEIADVGEAPQDWATLGGLVNVDEAYSITCWVTVSTPATNTFREAKNRAFELLAITEEALRVEDPFGLKSSYNYFETRFSGVVTAKGGVATNGWAYEISFTVDVAAII